MVYNIYNTLHTTTYYTTRHKYKLGIDSVHHFSPIIQSVICGNVGMRNG
jgi:hypothetical protein